MKMYFSNEVEGLDRLIWRAWLLEMQLVTLGTASECFCATLGSPQDAPRPHASPVALSPGQMEVSPVRCSASVTNPRSCEILLASHQNLCGCVKSILWFRLTGKEKQVLLPVCSAFCPSFAGGEGNGTGWVWGDRTVWVVSTSFPTSSVILAGTGKVLGLQA